MGAMKKTDSVFKDVVTAKNCVCKCVPEGHNFFYNLDLGRFKEWGIGSIKDKVLNRVICFYVQEDGVKYESRNGVPCDVYDGTGTVRSYIPSDFRHLMAFPNSVLSTMCCGTLSPIELQDNTVLGRFEDRIQSINSGEMGEMLKDVIPEMVCKNTGPLVLGTHLVDITGKNSKIAVDSIYLKPGNRPNPAQPGTIFFNSQSKTFEGYDGKQWVPLS